MELSDLSSLVTIVAIIVFAIPVVLAGIGIVVVVANRADPDASGRRPLAVYLFAVSFLAVFATLLASYGVVRQLCRLIASSTDPDSGSFDDGSGDGSDNGDSGSGLGFYRPSSLLHHLDAPEIKHPLGDSIARGAVGLGVIVLVAGIVLLLHLRAAHRISTGELVTAGDPVARVRQSYVAAVSFLSVVLFVAGIGVAIYKVFALISPTVFDPSQAPSHTVSLRTLIPAAYLALASAAVLVLHLRSTPSSQRPDFSGLPLLPFGRFRHAPVPTVDGAYDVTPDEPAVPQVIAVAPAPVPAVQPPTPVLEDAPRTPRKRAASTAGGEELGAAPARRPRPKPRPKSD